MPWPQRSDPYALYQPNMGNSPSQGPGLVGCGISRTALSGSYSYSVTPGDQNLPVNWVTWGDAARFCNWLQNGQPTGVEGNGTTETGSYNLGGGTSDAALLAVTRSSTAGYVLPTDNEWYKAAYYKSGGTAAGYWAYATRSNSAPSSTLSSSGTNNANLVLGTYPYYTYTDPTTYLTPIGSFEESPGPYGTYDMGGDVWQWNETYIRDLDGIEWRGMRGASFSYSSDYMASSYRAMGNPSYEFYDVGFRVASVPEPTSLALLFAGGFCLFAYAWRRRRQAA